MLQFSFVLLITHIDVHKIDMLPKKNGCKEYVCNKWIVAEYFLNAWETLQRKIAPLPMGISEFFVKKKRKK